MYYESEERLDSIEHALTPTGEAGGVRLHMTVDVYPGRAGQVFLHFEGAKGWPLKRKDLPRAWELIIDRMYDVANDKARAKGLSVKHSLRRSPRPEEA